MQAPFDPQPVVLEGAHVCLQPLGPEHAADLLEAAQDDAIWLYMPIPRPRTMTDVQAMLADARAAAAGGTQVPFGIVRRETGRAVGSTRYLDIDRSNRAVEIGWTWLGSAAQRTAINTECKYLLLAHAFDALGAIRVQLKTDGRNTRAQRAIVRIGAAYEGTLRRHRILWDGYVRDTVYYSVTAAEWPAVQRRLRAKLADQASGGAPAACCTSRSRTS